MSEHMATFLSEVVKFKTLMDLQSFAMTDERAVTMSIPCGFWMGVEIRLVLNCDFSPVDKCKHEVLRHNQGDPNRAECHECGQKMEARWEEI